MKIRLFAALVIALLSLSVLTGCVTGNAQALPTESPATEPPVTEAAVPQSTAPTATDRITKDEAQKIALKDAGLTKDQVRGLKAELDYDNGTAHYDVEFSHDGWEYDYEIHAETGRILSREKDRDD